MTNDNVIRPRVAAWGPSSGPVADGSSAPAWAPEPVDEPGPGARESGPDSGAPAGPGAPVENERGPGGAPEPGPRISGPADESGPGAPAREPFQITLSPPPGRAPRGPRRLPEVDLGRVVDAGAPVVEAAGTALLWIGAGAFVVVPRAVAEWVWQPNRAAEAADQRAAAQQLARQVRKAVAALDVDDPAAAAKVGTLQRQHENVTDAAEQKRRELRQDRGIRAGVLVLGGGPAGWWGVPALVEWLPWWADLGAGGATAAGLALLGRAWLRGRDGDDELPVGEVDGEAPVVPVGLLLDASDRGAVATLQEALAAVKARAVVDTSHVVRGRWGFEFEIRAGRALSLGQLDELAHALNVRRGGLIVSPVAGATQRYLVRTILRDLLAGPVATVEAPPGWTLTQRAPLVKSYDGELVAVPLLDSALLLGGTGTGKSTALRGYARWLAGRAHLVGIDLVGGADLGLFRKAMHEAVFGSDVVLAERALRFLVALIADRTARLAEAGGEWSASMGRPWFLLVDELWSLTQHKRLSALVDEVIVSGRKVWVRVIGANNKRQKDLMRSRVWTSQIDTTWLFGMSPDDEAALPAEWRAGGARPSTLRPAKVGDPRDAGKAFAILGGETRLVRWPDLSKDESREVAEAAGAPPLDEHDLAVWAGFTGGTGLPRLVSLVREAIVAHSAGRDVARASCAEIADYCSARGVPLAANTVANELSRVMGKTCRPRTRDMNFEPGRNPKGIRLDDFDQAVQLYLAGREG